MTINLPDVITIELPETILIPQPYVYLAAWWALIFVVTLSLKIANKGPHMKEGIIAAISILIMYVFCMLIFKYNPMGLKNYIGPLPFLKRTEDHLLLMVYRFNENGKVCIPEFFSQVLSLFVLAFLVNQVYEHKPPNLKTPGWLVYRFFSTMFCIIVHYAVFWGFRKVLNRVPEGSLLEDMLPHLPLAILCVILVLYILGTIRNALRRFYKVVNFAFEGLNGFFYTNRFGKILTRSIYTTGWLTAFGFGLQKICESYSIDPTLPMGSLSLLSMDLGGYVTLIALFVLWIIVGFLM